MEEAGKFQIYPKLRLSVKKILRKYKETWIDSIPQRHK